MNVELAKKARDSSEVRNSHLRRHTSIFDEPMEWAHQTFRWLKADHLTVIGIGFSILGIEVAEYQNRMGKYSPKLTLLAITSSVVGALNDLWDGKLARLERAEITNQKQNHHHEKMGQVKDPAADGFIEGYQALASAQTAYQRGDKFGVKAALFKLRTTNLARTVKAVANSFGVAVPETYSFLDPRFWGTSLGRKAPNYIATMAPEIKGIPVQAILDTASGVANVLVAADRISRIFFTKPTLSRKEVEHGRTRAVYLGVQSIANFYASKIAEKHLK